MELHNGQEPRLRIDVAILITNNNKKILSEDKKISFHNKSFVLCESCLWSATSYSVDNNTDTISACPVRSCDKLESFPLCIDNCNTFDYNPKRGISFKFDKNNIKRTIQ